MTIERKQYRARRGWIKSHFHGFTFTREKFPWAPDESGYEYWEGQSLNGAYLALTIRTGRVTLVSFTRGNRFNQIASSLAEAARLYRDKEKRREEQGRSLYRNFLRTKQMEAEVREQWSKK